MEGQRCLRGAATRQDGHRTAFRQRPNPDSLLETSLTEPADKGTISLAGPPGQNVYKLNLSIDQLGHGVLCESTTAASKLPEYADRRCAD